MTTNCEEAYQTLDLNNNDCITNNKMSDTDHNIETPIKPSGDEIAEKIDSLKIEEPQLKEENTKDFEVEKNDEKNDENPQTYPENSNTQPENSPTSPEKSESSDRSKPLLKSNICLQHTIVTRVHIYTISHALTHFNPPTLAYVNS